MGLILQNPFILKTLIRYLLKNKELSNIRTICMEIIFNLLISNNEIFLECLDSPLCNFYDALSKLIYYNSLSQFEENQFKDLREILKKTVYIILEMQNPLVKTQIFNNTLLTKYIRENNYNVYPRYDLDYIYNELKEIKDFLNFNGYVDLIHRLINAFKCWVQNSYLKNIHYEKITNNFLKEKNIYDKKEVKLNSFEEEINMNKSKSKVKGYDDIVFKLQEIISIFIQIFNIEWKEGLKHKSHNKNILIYNLVKLFEWLSLKNLHYLIFDNTEEISFSNLIIFWSKIQDFYQNLIIDDFIEKKEILSKEKIEYGNLGKTPTNSKILLKQQSLNKIQNDNTSNSNNTVKTFRNTIENNNTNFNSNSMSLSKKEMESLKKNTINNGINSSQIISQSININNNNINSIQAMNSTNTTAQANSKNGNLTFRRKNSAVNNSKPILSNPLNKGNLNSDDGKQKHLSSNIFNKIYHLLSLKLLNIISQIFILNNEKYDKILERAKIGVQIGTLFRTQYSILNQIFDKKVNDVNLLNNFIQENNLRLTLFEQILKTKSNEIRMQFLDTNFIEFLVTDISNEYRKFNTNFKKISLEFLVFKESYPVRMEALSFIYYILTNKENKKNKIIYDEFIKNMKKHMFVHREVINIKNAIKGPKIHSIMVFFSIILATENKDLINIIVN